MIKEENLHLSPSSPNPGSVTPHCKKEHAESLQSSLTLCNLMDCCLPGSSVHGTLRARILEWVAMPSSKKEELSPKLHMACTWHMA